MITAGWYGAVGMSNEEGGDNRKFVIGVLVVVVLVLVIMYLAKQT
jgi:hypothetical protein